MIRERISLIIKLYIVIDLCVILCSFFAAYGLRSWLSFVLPIPPLMGISGYHNLLLFILPIWMGLLSANNTYISQRGKPFLPLIWTILVCTLLLTLEKIALFKCLQYLRKQGKNIKQVLIIGTEPEVQLLVKKIHQHPETGFVIRGFLSAIPEEVGRNIYGYKVLGTCADLSRILHAEIIDEVIIATPIFDMHKTKPALEVCEQMGINCRIVVDSSHDASNFKMFIDSMLDIPLISFSYRERMFYSLWIKRVLDMLVSLILLIILAPIFFLIGYLIKRDSPGSAIFKQVRSGLNGRKFVMYKFRTMYAGAEALRSKLQGLSEVSGPIFKMEHDPALMNYRNSITC
jgi:hypothetical protein